MTTDTDPNDPVQRYLVEFERELKQRGGMAPEEALRDAREYLAAEAAALTRAEPGLQPEEVYARLVASFGSPEEVASNYQQAAPPVEDRAGIAPGWRISCSQCGRSAPLAHTGAIRIGARSIGKHVLGWCRECRRLRWLRITRDLDRVTILPNLGRRPSRVARYVPLLHWAALACLIAMGGFLLARDNSQPAPQIVETIPKQGATDVDPTLSEIRVTFDRDMKQGGYSFCGGGPQFPNTRAKPYWKDKRTCVLPVDLAPGRDYRLGFNCPGYQNFRSAQGVPLQPVTITFSTVDQPDHPAAASSPGDAVPKAVDTRRVSYCLASSSTSLAPLGST